MNVLVIYFLNTREYVEFFSSFHVYLFGIQIAKHL